MTVDAAKSASALRAKTRLDQWLWFARLAKSRSFAARLCAGGGVTLNGGAVDKANHAVRVGDVIVVPQGAWQHTVRVLALGQRRGPAAEARLLYEPAAPTVRLRDLAQDWTPLLDDDETTEFLSV